MAGDQARARARPLGSTQAVDRLAALFRQAQARHGDTSLGPSRHAAPGDGDSPAVCPTTERHRRGPSRPRDTTCGWAIGTRIRQTRPPGRAARPPGHRHRGGRGRPLRHRLGVDRPPRSRPRAVVLIETLRAVDRLRAIAAGVDAVDRGRADAGGPAALRAHAWRRRARRPPRCCWSITMRTRAAEAARVPGAGQRPGGALRARQAVQELLEREVPDLMLLADAAARRRRRHRGPDRARGPALPPDADRLHRARTRCPTAWPRCGPAPTTSCRSRRTPSCCCRPVVVRAERGRRLRELILRDELTGLLNHATLLAELEYAVDYARRHGGPLSAAGLRPGPLPRGQRAVRPSRRRPGAAPRRPTSSARTSARAT